MAIKKQEFYEGAALHILARTGTIENIQYKPPFFYLNNRILIHLKYSTRGRSPWGFTFTLEEQLLLGTKANEIKIAIGLICGADGVAAFTYDAYCTIAAPSNSSIHISCYRRRGEYYEVKGPAGTLNWKVAPANWQKILHSGGCSDNEAL